MKFIETLKLAVSAIWAHKLRSALTLLGMIVGVTAFVVVVSLIAGFNRYVDEKIAGIGAKSFTVQRFNPLEDFKDTDTIAAAQRRNKDLTMDDYDYLKARAQLVGKMGAGPVDEFLRFYVAVGLFHNRNIGRNPLTDALVPMYVDFIAMLDDWVEQRKAPADTQVLSDMDLMPPFAVHATFPMCRYPMYPRYTGEGNPKSAASYSCVK